MTDPVLVAVIGLAGVIATSIGAVVVALVTAGRKTGSTTTEPTPSPGIPVTAEADLITELRKQRDFWQQRALELEAEHDHPKENPS